MKYGLVLIRAGEGGHIWRNVSQEQCFPQKGGWSVFQFRTGLVESPSSVNVDIRSCKEFFHTVKLLSSFAELTLLGILTNNIFLYLHSCYKKNMKYKSSWGLIAVQRKSSLWNQRNSISPNSLMRIIHCKHQQLMASNYFVHRSTLCSPKCI